MKRLHSTLHLFLLLPSMVYALHDPYIDRFAACTGISSSELPVLDQKDVVRSVRLALVPAFTCRSSPLYRAFPQLSFTLPSFMLGQFPTRVVRLDNLESCIAVGECYMKLDSESGIELIANRRFFGGNKIRKLEFILADAWLSGAQSILAFGCAGSNFATATAVCARRLGLGAHVILAEQPNSHIVRRNLAIMSRMHARMYHSDSSAQRSLKAVQVCKQLLEDGKDMPYVVPVGGSNALGAVGYVNAAFELREQLERDEFPEPDIIYVAAGSYGTAAGLLLGIKAAGLKSRLIAVAVEPVEDAQACMDGITILARQANELLHEKDPSFPLFDFDAKDFSVDTRCCGNAYGVFTPQAAELCNLVRAYERIELDGVYSAKAFDALKRDAQAGLLKDKKVLFWHTFCSASVEQPVDAFDYHILPRDFHRYFEYDVQPLDRTLCG